MARRCLVTTNFVFLTSISILIHASKLLNTVAQDWVPAPSLHLLPDRYLQRKRAKGCWFEPAKSLMLSYGTFFASPYFCSRPATWG